MEGRERGLTLVRKKGGGPLDFLNLAAKLVRQEIDRLMDGRVCGVCLRWGIEERDGRIARPNTRS